MQKRHQHINIPIEIMRTIVAISETGSLSRAGDRLGLSQPAVSSQVKRIETIIGGSLFSKTSGGSQTTELGKIALHHARRVLESNDQMLRLGGNKDGPQPLRLGLSTLLAEEFINHQTAESLSGIVIHTDHSTTIAKGLVDGYIDVACIFENQAMDEKIGDLIINERDDPLVWVRAKNFVLSPGAPIPILTWPGDDWMIRTLTKRGINYNIVFNSPDYHAKITAVKAGIGLSAIPKRIVPPDLVTAREYYLPDLPPIKSILCARLGLETEKATSLIKQLSTLFFDKSNSR
jgi:DNA-binding transcriptional LysR family regulator